MITSAGNSRIQHLRRLSGRRSARLDSGAFVVDGPVLVAEALAGPLDVLEVFVGEHAQPPDTSAMGAAPEIVVCADGLLERVLSARAPQPMAAVVALPALDLAALAGRSGDVLVLDRLGDPGNAGTLIRAAEAAGWSAVVFSSNSVDPFAPKVVRASAGSVLRVPVIATDVSAIEVLAALAPGPLWPQWRPGGPLIWRCSGLAMPCWSSATRPTGLDRR